MPVQKDLATPKDITYIYDGTFEGFLCCVHRSVYSHTLPTAIYPQSDAQPTLFDVEHIPSRQQEAAKVLASIPKHMSQDVLTLVQTVYLSCLKEKELALLRFLLLGYKEGASVRYMMGHPDVEPILKAEKHLGGEVHLLKGFVRFSDYDGALAATITPKNFVLPFIAGHFVSRYSEENFMIYDKTHKAALIYENRKHRIVPLEDIQFPQAGEDELNYRAMWKQFYHTIAIEARYNPKCRMTHMPKRYWENMTEMAELL